VAGGDRVSSMVMGVRKVLISGTRLPERERERERDCERARGSEAYGWAARGGGKESAGARAREEV
jgi:hypothetical protein